MRKRIVPPPGFVDTIDAAKLCGVATKSLAVYRLKAYARHGPKWHRFDGRPVYALADLKEWNAARAGKLKAKAARLETALSPEDAAALAEIGRPARWVQP